MAINDGGRAPRAVIHKRILDSAEAEPDASLEALAGDIPGASPDLVERVLDEYGDPGEAAGTTEEPTMPDSAPTPTAADLTDKQCETLRAIGETPDATQSELAERLGVSRATVNKRLNDIDGFEWADRRAFVETVLDDVGFTRSPETPAESDSDATSASEAEAAVDGGHLLDPDTTAAVDQLQERLARLEQRFEASTGAAGPALGDTELLAKVMRAVMADEGIAEDEEVAILEALR